MYLQGEAGVKRGWGSGVPEACLAESTGKSRAQPLANAAAPCM